MFEPISGLFWLSCALIASLRTNYSNLDWDTYLKHGRSREWGPSCAQTIHPPEFEKSTDGTPSKRRAALWINDMLPHALQKLLLAV
jgi:hypothetical protein